MSFNLFVMGTLKKGHNDYAFEDAKWGGPAVTVSDHYRMYNIGFPACNVVEKGGHAIKGELWLDVPDDKLSGLDSYEGHPTYFERKEIQVTDEKGNVHTALMYHGEDAYHDAMLRGVLPTEPNNENLLEWK